jgi:hypothetical protein
MGDPPSSSPTGFLPTSRDGHPLTWSGKKDVEREGNLIRKRVEAGLRESNVGDELPIVKPLNRQQIVQGGAPKIAFSWWT